METALTVYDQPFRIVDVDIEKVMRAFAEATGGRMNVFELEKWQIPAGGATQWQQGNKATTAHVGVIVHHHPSRAYWEYAFGSGPAQPPQCQSFDGLTGYGNPGGRCIDPVTRVPVCRFAVFGSKLLPSGKPSRAPACKNAHAIYVITPHSALPVVLLAPSMSMLVVQDYHKALASQGYFPSDVVTEFTLETVQNVDNLKFSRLALRAIGLVSDATRAAIEGCGQTMRKTIAVQAQATLPASVAAASQPDAPATPPSPSGLVFQYDDDIADPAVPAGIVHEK